MDWGSLLAMFAGGLTGGGEAYQQQQVLARQKQQQDRLAQQQQDEANYRAQELQLRKDAAARQTFETGQKDTSTALGQAGAWGRVSPSLEADANKYGLGDRLQQTPDLTSTPAIDGTSVYGLPASLRAAFRMPDAGAPKTFTTVKPTGAEIAARDKADADAAAAQERKIKLSEWLKTQRPEVQSAVQLGQLTGKEPTLQPDALVDPAVQAQRDADAAGKKEGTLNKFRLQLHAGERAIDQKYDEAGVGDSGATTAKAIAEYRVPPPSPRSLATPAGEALMKQVLAANPDYDATQFPTKQKMRAAFTSGPQGQQLGALNTGILHLDRLNEVALAMGNGSFQPGNQLYNWWREKMGDSAPTNFNGARDFMAGEIATAMKKSGATDTEIAKVSASLKSSQSPEQFSGYIGSVALPMLEGKAQTSNEQYHAVMGANDPWSPITPSAKAVLDKFHASGKAAAAGARGRSGPSVGEQRTVNGKLYEWDGTGWLSK